MTIINILEQGMEIQFPGDYYNSRILSSVTDDYESGILLGFKINKRVKYVSNLIAKFLAPDGKILEVDVRQGLFHKNKRFNIKLHNFFQHINVNINKINSVIKTEKQPLVVFDYATPIKIYGLERHPEHPTLLYYFNKDKGKIRFPKMDRIMFYKGTYEE